MIVAGFWKSTPGSQPAGTWGWVPETKPAATLPAGFPVRQRRTRRLPAASAATGQRRKHYSRVTALSEKDPVRRTHTLAWRPVPRDRRSSQRAAWAQRQVLRGRAGCRKTAAGKTRTRGRMLTLKGSLAARSVPQNKRRERHEGARAPASGRHRQCAFRTLRDAARAAENAWLQ